MALKVALDTNRYTDFRKGEETVAQTLESADEIILPYIVVAELKAGFSVGTRGAANEQLLSDFLREKDVKVIFPDDQTILQYAAAFRDLRQRGKMIPVNDLWIAALVLQHHLHLCSRDTHFDHLPQIPRV